MTIELATSILVDPKVRRVSSRYRSEHVFVRAIEFANALEAETKGMSIDEKELTLTLAKDSFASSILPKQPAIKIVQAIVQDIAKTKEAIRRVVSESNAATDAPKGTKKPKGTEEPKPSKATQNAEANNKPE